MIQLAIATDLSDLSVCVVLEAGGQGQGEPGGLRRRRRAAAIRAARASWQCSLGCGRRRCCGGQGQRAGQAQAAEGGGGRRCWRRRRRRRGSGEAARRRQMRLRVLLQLGRRWGRTGKRAFWVWFMRRTLGGVEGCGHLTADHAGARVTVCFILQLMTERRFACSRAPSPPVAAATSPLATATPAATAAATNATLTISRPHALALPSGVCVPACVSACVPSCVPACLRACVPACLRACVPACLRACVPACLRACVRCLRALVVASCLLTARATCHAAALAPAHRAFGVCSNGPSELPVAASSQRDKRLFRCWGTLDPTALRTLVAALPHAEHLPPVLALLEAIVAQARRGEAVRVVRRQRALGPADTRSPGRTL
jgi:hypothetical protein